MRCAAAALAVALIAVVAGATAPGSPAAGTCARRGALPFLDAVGSRCPFVRIEPSPPLEVRGEAVDTDTMYPQVHHFAIIILHLIFVYIDVLHTLIFMSTGKKSCLSSFLIALILKKGTTIVYTIFLYKLKLIEGLALSMLLWNIAGRKKNGVASRKRFFNGGNAEERECCHYVKNQNTLFRELLFAGFAHPIAKYHHQHHLYTGIY
ncbi:hypothetical protein ACJX0J_023096 [Zea mays]